MKADNKVVVIGAGISGAAAARVLAERGKKVLLVEKNDHVGGSVYDYVDDGIIVQAHRTFSTPTILTCLSFCRSLRSGKSTTIG